MTQFESSSDLQTYSYGLDTPTKYLNDSSAFSLGSGLTPSLFGSLGGPRGFTPSMNEGGNEFNPFEMSLGGGGGDKTRRSSFSNMLEDGHTNSHSTDFDLLSSNTLANGRKRALSSPAITTPGGSKFPFVVQPTQVPSGAMPNLAIKPTKRPRMSVVSSASGMSDFRVLSAGNSDTSPDSSSVPTPPDSSNYLNHDMMKDPSPLGHSQDLDIDVNGEIGMNSQQQIDSNNIFSQLQQQRHFLLANNQPSFSQPQPLPLRPLDIKIKNESAEPSPIATMPPLTRSASKKGKAPARTARAVSSADGSPEPQPKPKRAAGGKKKAQQKKDEELEQHNEDDGDLSEDSLKRKQFLERNRIAACKSRQKKKEKVGKLEQNATDLCHKNQLLQASALALRQEILTLRQIIQTHDGCSCEHAQGYLQRDKEGRGIALLDNLAGRTMHLDYSVPPNMGSTDDVYSYLEDYARNGTVKEALGHGVAPPNSQAMLPIQNAPMPNLAAAPSFAPSTASKQHARRQSDTTLFANSSRSAPSLSADGVFTRSAAQQQTSSQPQPPSYNYDSMSSSNFGLTFDSNTSNSLSLAPVDTLDPTAQGLLGPAPSLHRRQSSAPPTTPSWGESQKGTGNNGGGGGDYFSYSSVHNA